MNHLTPEQEWALAEFNAARKPLGSVFGKKSGGVENLYGQAYQRMVQLGMAQQLKKKYRKVQHAL
jgi:hypothetical protein